eukprot:PhF_6_TR4837/c1_g1_i2/m.6735/K08292/EEF2K; elongation factor 2 kinase
MDVPSTPPIDFNQPLPRDLTPWTEPALIHQWNVEKGVWSSRDVNVVIERTAFARGAMRLAYRYVEIPYHPVTSLIYVAKRSRKRLKEERLQYFQDVRMQSEAQKWAQCFNAMHPPKEVKFLDPFVLELLRPTVLTLGAELMLHGTFLKHNNNYGYVASQERYTPQAFSHFTYEYSKGELVVCDIQGVDDRYTDPQIHSADGKGYGRGNLGAKGIQRFLESHKCNPVCEFLRLRPIEMAAPRKKSHHHHHHQHQTVVVETSGVGGSGNAAQAILTTTTTKTSFVKRSSNIIKRVPITSGSNGGGGGLWNTTFPTVETTSIVTVSFKLDANTTLWLSTQHGVPSLSPDPTAASLVYVVTTMDRWGPVLRIVESSRGKSLCVADTSAPITQPARLVFSKDREKSQCHLRWDPTTFYMKYATCGRYLSVSKTSWTLVADGTSKEVVELYLTSESGGGGSSERICSHCEEVFVPGDVSTGGVGVGCEHKSAIL